MLCWRGYSGGGQEGHRQPAGAPFMAEARQTLDPVLLIQLVPQPDCVVVKQQHFSDRLTAQSIVQQYQRVGATGQAMLEILVVQDEAGMCVCRITRENGPYRVLLSHSRVPSSRTLDSRVSQ
jgi:hypothetical protein